MNTGMDEVVRQARDGRAEAFESLVQHHGPEMYRLAAAIVGSDDARDVAQKSFVAAWRDLPKLRQVDRFEVWLRRIVVNRSRNALRSRGRRPTQRLEGMTVAETASRSPDFRDAVHERDALDAAFDDHAGHPVAYIRIYFCAHGVATEAVPVHDPRGTYAASAASRRTAR